MRHKTAFKHRVLDFVVALTMMLTLITGNSHNATAFAASPTAVTAAPLWTNFDPLTAKLTIVQAATTPTYDFDADLPPEVAERIKKGIELGQQGLGDVGSFTVKAGNSITTNPNGDTLASATIGFIYVYTGTDGWKNSTENDQIATLVHEYMHLVQYFQAKSGNEASDPDTIDRDGPVWLSEGSAEFVSYRVLDKNGLMKYDDAKKTFTDEAKQFKMPLEQLSTVNQTSSTGRAQYALGFMACDYLAANYGGDDNIIKFYTEIGNGTAWQDAFLKVFNISTSDFYQKFEEYRAANFPPA